MSEPKAPPPAPANPDHVIAVLMAQRANLFDALTMAEIAKTALAAKVAELEAEVRQLTVAPPE